MSLETPTTQEISDNLIAQLESQLNQSIPLLPKSFMRVLAKALSGIFILLYKYGGFIFLQLFIKTASDTSTTINGITLNPLTEWGILSGVGEPTEATNAELLIDITVDNQTGSIPSGTQLIGSINGVTYITIGSISLDASTVQGTIKAVSDQQGGGGSGTIGNLTTGDIVSFANPLANIQRDVTVVSQSVTGADAEDVEVYRQRILDRWQKPPQGGAYSDYEIWGEEVEGILNIYPYTSDCPGQVDVYVEATVASSGDSDGIPTTAQLEAVLESILFDDSGLPSRRPANALVNTFAISRVEIDVNIVGLTTENLAQTKIDIENALTEYMLEREPFIEGLSIPPRKDSVTQTSVGGTIDSIVSAAGGLFTSASIFKDAVNTPLYTLEIGEKAKLGTVTYL